MLYLTTNDGQEYEYNNTIHNYVKLKVQDIRSIKATDYELSYIIDNYDNIPMYKSSHNNECCWFGDHAKFIAVVIGAAKY
jgi:hypothetical protein